MIALMRWMPPLDGIACGPVAVWYRSCSVMCNKGDEPWAQSGRLLTVVEIHRPAQVEQPQRWTSALRRLSLCWLRILPAFHALRPRSVTQIPLRASALDSPPRSSCSNANFTAFALRKNRVSLFSCPLLFFKIPFSRRSSSFSRRKF